MKIIELKNKVLTINRTLPLYLGQFINDISENDEMLNKQAKKQEFDLPNNYENKAQYLSKEIQKEENRVGLRSGGDVLILALLFGLGLYTSINTEYNLIWITMILCFGYYILMIKRATKGNSDTKKKYQELKKGITEYESYQKQLKTNKKERLEEIKRNFIQSEIKLLTQIKTIDNEIETHINILNSKKKRITSGIKDTILKMDPYEFEHYVADYFRERGYAAKVSNKSSDGGIDILLKTSNDEIPVQCKRYNSTVSTPDIQKFLGVIAQHSYQEGYFVCSNYYSRNAKRIANNNNIKIFTIDDIALKIDLDEFNKEYYPKLIQLDGLRKDLYLKFFGEDYKTMNAFLEAKRGKIKEYKNLTFSNKYSDISDHVNDLTTFTKKIEHIISN